MSKIYVNLKPLEITIKISKYLNSIVKLKNILSAEFTDFVNF